jgi:hypothetical protein
MGIWIDQRLRILRNDIDGSIYVCSCADIQDPATRTVSAVLLKCLLSYATKQSYASRANRFYLVERAALHRC